MTHSVVDPAPGDLRTSCEFAEKPGEDLRPWLASAFVNNVADVNEPVNRRAQRRQQELARRRRRRGMVLLAPLLVVGLVGAGVVLFSGGDDAEPEFSGTVLDLELGDYWFQGDLTGPAGPIRLAATNVGADRHNVGIRRVKISRELQPGESLVLDVGTLAAGEYELYCDLPGHVEAGMVAPLVIT
jgi:hypothetical protein